SPRAAARSGTRSSSSTTRHRRSGGPRDEGPGRNPSAARVRRDRLRWASMELRGRRHHTRCTMTAMSVFACICETIAIFERDVLKPPCEIALDPRVYDLLECEVRERGLVEFGTG